jgi:hypothetical protein
LPVNCYWVARRPPTEGDQLNIDNIDVAISIKIVAASYNRGMAGMGRAIDNQEVSSYYDLFLNDETSRYVFRILACKEIIEHPLKYGFKIKPEHLYAAEELRYVEVKQSIPDLIAFAKAQGTNYKLLKRHNPWLRDEKLTVRKGKVYQIALPQ